MEQSEYRQESGDEVVERSELVQEASGLAWQPARALRVSSRGISPLAARIKAVKMALAIVEVLLAVRFLLKLMAANPEAGFAILVYGVTAPLMAPFVGLLAAPLRFEASVLVAMAVYGLGTLLGIRIVRLALNRTWSRSRQDFTRQ